MHAMYVDKVEGRIDYFYQQMSETWGHLPTTF
jgi:hypothetical protein